MYVGDVEDQWICEEPGLTAQFDQLVSKLAGLQ